MEKQGKILYTNKGKGIVSVLWKMLGKCFQCGLDHGPPLKAICKIPSCQGHLECLYLPLPETIIYAEDISPFFVSNFESNIDILCNFLYFTLLVSIDVPLATETKNTYIFYSTLRFSGRSSTEQEGAVSVPSSPKPY